MDCRFFSFGAVSKDGPSKEMAEGTNFEMTLLGKGWKQEGKSEGKPDREVSVVIVKYVTVTQDSMTPLYCKIC